MIEKILTLLEAAGIQEYIFGSNQLAQNIGASELVTLSTTKWVIEKLNEVLQPNKHNVKWEDNSVIYKTSVPPEGWEAEVVYAGGGNSMILFAKEEDAKEFTRQLTEHLLHHARGLQLIIAHKKFNYNTDTLSVIHKELRQKVATRKLNRTFSTPQLGLGVTAGCVYTGLPAVGLDTDPNIVGAPAAKKAKSYDDNYAPRLISQAVAHKLQAEDEGKKRLHEVLPQVRKKNYGFIYNFDELGSKDDSSYIAVVHADGNKIGKRFKKIADKHPNATDNDNYVTTLRTFSETMQAKSKRALNATVAYLFTSLQADKFGGVVPIPTTKKQKTPLLPFRPIVFGGDDVTFVCDGRLGLDLAVKYMQEFTKSNAEEGELCGGPVFARAGVAIVKTHYPFSRAYDLAEQLAQQAKYRISEVTEESATVIDWHFATTGMMFDITEVRKREYMDGRLLMRPLLVDNQNKSWRNWANFTTIINAFQSENDWASKRNKMKALRDALRNKSVNLFLTNYSLGNLPPIETASGTVQRTGWHKDDHCAYYDAIEATDYFVSLENNDERGNQ